MQCLNDALPPRFEDHPALDGGPDGLKVIKQILTLAPKILPDHGYGNHLPDTSAQTHTHTHLGLIPDGGGGSGLSQEQHVLKNTRIVLPL